MARATKTHWEGAKELQRKLKKLESKQQKRVMRKSVKEGSKLVVDAAKLNAKRIDDPHTRDAIYKNIKAKKMKKRDAQREHGDMGYQIGVNVSETAKGGDTFYYGFVELGTRYMQAEPYLRPALENNWRQVMDVVAKKMKQEIERELNK